LGQVITRVLPVSLGEESAGQTVKIVDNSGLVSGKLKIISVILVSDVLEAHKKLVSLDRENFILYSEWICDRVSSHILSILVIIFEVRGYLIIRLCLGRVPGEGKEVLKGFINGELECPLKRDLERLLNPEQMITRKCGDTVAELICLIHWLFHTLVIIFEDSAVLHQLNFTIFQGGTTLGAIIQHGEFKARFWIDN